jgi:hypothetical protein
MLLVGALFGLPNLSFAQVTVTISDGFRGAYEQLLPEFEKTSTVKITTTMGN